MRGFQSLGLYYLWEGKTNGKTHRHCQILTISPGGKRFKQSRWLKFNNVLCWFQYFPNNSPQCVWPRLQLPSNCHRRCLWFSALLAPNGVFCKSSQIEEYSEWSSPLLWIIILVVIVNIRQIWKWVSRAGGAALPWSPVRSLPRCLDQGVRSLEYMLLQFTDMVYCGVIYV